MKCLILAAGYATRLYPLTENFPKPLLKVQDKTILDWLIDDIDRAGIIDEYIVISNHKFAHHFTEWAGNKMSRTKADASETSASNKATSRGMAAIGTTTGGTATNVSSTTGIKITVVDDGTSTNETRLGAVKDIQYAIEELGLGDSDSKDGYLVIAGDNLLDFSLTSFLAYAEDKKTSCIMRYYEPAMEKLVKCGVVTLDEQDHDLIVNMTEKSPEPATHWCCPPFYYYTADDARKIPEAIASGCGVDAPGSFIAWLSKQSPVHAMEMPGSRYDIGNITSYEQVQKNYKGIQK